jgi:hypothetical protein
MFDSSPQAAHRALLDLWSESNELNWFLGAAPANFADWGVRRTREVITFSPPDGSPGFEIPRSEFEGLISKAYDRVWANSVFPKAPRHFVRRRVRKSSRSAFDRLMVTALWQEAEARAPFFFHTMSRRAARERGLADELASVDAHYREVGLAFLPVAEWVARNYLDVCLCAWFQTALERGLLPFRSRVDLKKYIKAMRLLTCTGSPVRGCVKDMISEEERRLRRQAGQELRLIRKFEERKKEFEARVGGQILFTMRGRSGGNRRREWPYYSRELFNIVCHLVPQLKRPGRKRDRKGNYLRGEGVACLLAGRTLLLIADRWDPGSGRKTLRRRDRSLQELVRRRCNQLRKKRARPRPIGPLAKGPVWQELDVYVVPE